MGPGGGPPVSGGAGAWKVTWVATPFWWHLMASFGQEKKVSNSGCLEKRLGWLGWFEILCWKLRNFQQLPMDQRLGKSLEEEERRCGRSCNALVPRSRCLPVVQHGWSYKLIVRSCTGFPHQSGRKSNEEQHVFLDWSVGYRSRELRLEIRGMQSVLFRSLARKLRLKRLGIVHDKGIAIETAPAVGQSLWHDC